MNVHVFVTGKVKPEIFSDADFTVGVTSLIGQVTPAGTVQNITHYSATGDLWVYRLSPNPVQAGAVLRSNLAIYPAGKWDKALMVETPARKKKK